MSGYFREIVRALISPSYHQGAPSSLKIGEVEGSSSAVIEVINSTRPETYHGIYCKRCGKVINGEV